MQAIKFKTTLLGLATFMFFAIFIVSCQKSEIIQEETLQEVQKTMSPSEVEEGTYLTLPKDYDKKSDEGINNYLNGLSETELSTLEENYRINAYLEQNGLKEAVLEEMNEGDLFVNQDFSTHLSPKQLNDLSRFQADNQIEAYRNCFWAFWTCWGPTVTVYRLYCFGFGTDSFLFVSLPCR